MDKFAEEPAANQLTKYFHLDESDRRLIAERRGDHNKFGYALQLCTVRFLRTFLKNPIDVPNSVIAYEGAQLGFDRECLPRYLERRESRMEHSLEITNSPGYRYFDEQPERWRMLRWMYERAWLTAERPVVLFDLATARLVD